MFVVKVLGGLTIESTDRLVPAGALQRRRLSLLALLALAGERGLSRDRIEAYLWPESDSARARHALDQLLYGTRREIGYESVASSATDLRLNPRVVRADIWAFDEAVREERWEDAVRLYAGPVLNGVHLEDSSELELWIDAARMQRQQDQLGALDELAKAASQRGDATHAVRWRRRQAAADPLSVPIALDLMRALDAADDRTGALQHARLYQQLVTTTLQVEPDSEVAALAAAIAGPSTGHDNETFSPAPNVFAVSDNGDGQSSPQFPPPAGSTGATRETRSWRSHVGRKSAVVVGLSAFAAVFLARSQPHPSLSATPAARGAEQSADRASRVNQTSDAEARSLYLHARSLWEKRTRAPLEEAVVLFRQATERDPGYGAAYAGLAQSYAMLGYFGFGPADAMFPKARAAALRALELDPQAGDAYAALGQALAWEHEWARSETAYSQAIRLMPGDATAHQWYALLLAYLGRAREAAVHTGHASRLDPLSVQVNNMHGMMLYYAGDTDGALRQYANTVDAEPDSAWVRQNPWVLANFSRVAAAAGRHALAVRLAERAVEVVPGHPRPLIDLAYAYVVAGKPDSARASFARADSTHPHYAVYRAVLHGLLGEPNEAFVWFERVNEWPLPSLVTLNCEPRLAALRADPRFEKIRQRLNLPVR
jgi:DNA-binding SARP family transcriptional activator/Flp pilus assembly protein TadD